MSKFVKPLDHIFTHMKIAEREVAFGPFFLRVTSLTSLISLTNLDGGGGKSERGTFLNILLNSSNTVKKFYKFILKLFKIILHA